MKAVKINLLVLAIISISFVAFSKGDDTAKDDNNDMHSQKINNIKDTSHKKPMSYVRFRYTLEQPSEIRLVLFNETGDFSYVLEKGTKAAKDYEFKISRNRLPKGNYTFMLEKGSGFETYYFSVK